MRAGPTTEFVSQIGFAVPEKEPGKEIEVQRSERFHLCLSMSEFLEKNETRYIPNNLCAAIFATTLGKMFTLSVFICQQKNGISELY